MKFGVCGTMVARQADRTGVEIVEELQEMGYDYVELSLAHVAALSEGQHGVLLRRLEQSGLPCEACNNFYPPAVRLTGSDVSWPRVRKYTQLAVDRAAQLGAKVIVFGSSGAKNVPEGFPSERARAQIVDVLRLVADLVRPYGITVAIEPLNRQESNIVNTIQEGLALASEVHRPEIQLLVDYYHLSMEREDPAIVRSAGDAVRHVHLARVEGRTFPMQPDQSCQSLFAHLAAIGYDDRVSVEGFSQDFRNDAARALAVLKSLVPAR